MALTDFSIGDPIGTGSTGRVFRALHRGTATPVALKTLRSDGAREALSLERELAALARLDHPGILHLYDHGVAEEGDFLEAGTRWMALELASAGSLEDWSPGSWSEVESCLVEVLGALAHAHARGLVHRDLKPANLVRCGPLDVRPGLKIADFGLAWALTRDTAGLVRAGSPAFMPPEQVRGEVGALGPWSDLYALGCVAWLWTTGLPPFGWLEVQAALTAQLHRRVGTFRPRFPVPHGLEALLLELLDKDPGGRPTGAAQVLDRLRGSRSAGQRLLPVPVEWRGEQTAPSTAVLTGVGLGLFALRDPPVVGREATQTALWATLQSAADERRPAVVALTGAVGSGRRRLARWMRERVAELGCAAVLHGLEPTSLAAVWQLADHGPVIVDLTGIRANDDVTELVGGILLDADRVGPVLLIVDGSEGDPMIEELSALPGFSRLPLPPISAGVLADFAHEHLGLARGPAEIVAAGAQGNPGIAVTWVRGWIAGDRLLATPGGFQLVPGADPGAPLGLDDARRLQLDGVLQTLREPERLAFALGALLGSEARAREWLPLLQRVGLDRRHSPLRALVRADLVVATPSGWQLRDPAVRVALLDELDRHGDRAHFHAAVAEVLSELPATAERTEREGRHRLAAGDLEGAWAALTAAVELHRKVAQWTEIRAIVELLTSRADLASRPVADRYIVAYFGALAITNLESPLAAVAPVRRALELAPELEGDIPHRAIRLAVEVLALAGLSEESRQAMARTDPQHPTIRRVRAMLDLDEGNLDAAIAEYQALWDEEPLGKYANGLGIAYARRGEPEEAERWWLRGRVVLSENRKYVPLCNLALLWLLCGDASRALPFAKTAEVTSSEDGILHRGFVAVVVAVVAAANRDRAFFDRVRERALFHAHRTDFEDADELLRAVAVARELALPEHQRVLDLLSQRIRAHGA